MDTTTRAGRSLANSFAVQSGQGLILSDRTGALQAFHHDGTLSDADLVSYLERFADVGEEVQSTVTPATARVSYYPSQSNLTQPSYGSPYPYGAPMSAPSFGFGGGGGRGC